MSTTSVKGESTTATPARAPRKAYDEFLAVRGREQTPPTLANKRQISWNFGKGHQVEFFDAYGIKPDAARIRY